MSNENINIHSSREMMTPCLLKQELPITNEINNFVIKSRQTIKNILDKKDKRLLCVVGPCSIHDIEEAKTYASRLKFISNKLKNIFVVMRVYFEKPRTNLGWKGLIHDPHLNNSFDVNHGIYLARELLLYVNKIELPCGCEFLDVFTPQYVGDLISWGAIGARTTESQVHRQMVSGLSMPVGFKNSRSGNLSIPCDSILSASVYHSFIGINEEGKSSIFVTKGNPYCHAILRGSDLGENYKIRHINNLVSLLENYNLHQNIMVDCSHGNSNNNYKNQKYVLNNVMFSYLDDTRYIVGFMLESNINEGKQPLSDNLKPGVSITDGCISLEQTENLLLSSDELINLMLKKTKIK
jgi:3-deoxy-7-phosphoheptulonate synthase